MAGNVASNPAGGTSFCFECRALSGRGLCDGPITRPEESYRVCVCVSLSVTRCNSNTRTPKIGRYKEIRKRKKRSK